MYTVRLKLLLKIVSYFVQSISLHNHQLVKTKQKAFHLSKCVTNEHIFIILGLPVSRCTVC